MTDFVLSGLRPSLLDRILFRFCFQSDLNFCNVRFSLDVTNQKGCLSQHLSYLVHFCCFLFASVKFLLKMLLIFDIAGWRHLTQFQPRICQPGGFQKAEVVFTA